VDIPRPADAIKEVKQAADRLAIGCKELKDALGFLRGRHDNVAMRIEGLLLPLVRHLEEIAVIVPAMALLLESVEVTPKSYGA
jgi:hypothetical protein